MTASRITYVGPASLAVPTATKLADADGVDLTSSEPPLRSDDGEGMVILLVTLEGTVEAVEAAVAAVRTDLPAGATIGVE